MSVQRCQASEGTCKSATAPWSAFDPDRDGWTLGQPLRHLCELEREERRVRKIERLLKSSELPADKTFATVDIKRSS